MTITVGRCTKCDHFSTLCDTNGNTSHLPLSAKLVCDSCYVDYYSPAAIQNIRDSKLKKILSKPWWYKSLFESRG